MNTHPTYALGYDEILLKNFRSRSAQVHAAHLLPHLRPGMRVLDAGSGQGSISMDLARIVAPDGEVVGFDFEPSQVADAAAAAEKAGIKNIRFQVADVYSLPFPDASFDAVHMCALLIHLPRVQDGLRELKRVLKPGGVLSTRDPFFSGAFSIPENPLRVESMFMRGRAIDCAGGDGDFGKHSAQALHDAGFVGLAVTGNLEGGVRPDAIPASLEMMARTFEDGHFTKVLIDGGAATRERIREILEALRPRPDEPFCYFGVPHINIVARKP